MNGFVSRLESQGNNNPANKADGGQDRKPLSVLQSNGVCMHLANDGPTSFRRRLVGSTSCQCCCTDLTNIWRLTYTSDGHPTSKGLLQDDIDTTRLTMIVCHPPYATKNKQNRGHEIVHFRITERAHLTGTTHWTKQRWLRGFADILKSSPVTFIHVLNISTTASSFLRNRLF